MHDELCIAHTKTTYPDFWRYFKTFWLEDEQSIRWGNYFPYINTKLSAAEIEEVKAHDTNAFSEGRNSADRKMFKFEVKKTKHNSGAKLELLEQVLILHIITKYTFVSRNSFS